MDRLDELEAQSIYIFREAFERLRKVALLLYLSRDGKHYRSLGDADITFPIESNASTFGEIIAELDTTKLPERSRRAMDHESEDAFERLRAAGYLQPPTTEQIP